MQGMSDGSGSMSNALSDDPPNPMPPAPDRQMRDMGQCPSCGAMFGFASSGAMCASCTNADMGGMPASGTWP